MGTFDSLDEGVIKALDSKSAVKLLHKLIYAEAKRLSIPSDVISVPYEVDTPDGGIDAVFKSGQSFDGSELIFEGNAYYQVKSGKISFTESGLLDVLCVSKKKKSATRNLKPKVKQIAEENGTLVLFFTGQSSPKAENAIKNAEKIIKEGFKIKIVSRLKGREKAFASSIGKEKFDIFISKCSSFAKISSPLKIEGNTISLIIEKI